MNPKADRSINSSIIARSIHTATIKVFKLLQSNIKTIGSHNYLAIYFDKSYRSVVVYNILDFFVPENGLLGTF